jgi:hypothetical protein
VQDLSHGLDGGVGRAHGQWMQRRLRSCSRRISPCIRRVKLRR